MWQWIILGGFLLIGTIQDIKYKALTPMICIAVAVMVAGMIFLNDRDWMNCFLGLIPGIVVLLFAFFSRQAIGYGDGIVITILGFALGMKKGFCITLAAFLVASVVALSFLISQKAKRKTELPFVPFLAVAFMLTGIL